MRDLKTLDTEGQGSNDCCVEEPQARVYYYFSPRVKKEKNYLKMNENKKNCLSNKLPGIKIDEKKALTDISSLTYLTGISSSSWFNIFQTAVIKRALTRIGYS